MENKQTKIKNKDISYRNIIQIACFIGFILIFLLAMYTVYLFNSEGEEGKKDFCIYKNYSSYSKDHCHKIIDEALIESPRVVNCNSSSGYCFKYVDIRE